MKPSVETGKEDTPNLPDILRRYQNAHPEEDNREVLRDISQALSYIWQALQGGNIENTQPKKKENIEKHLREFLYGNFTIHDERGVNIAIIDIAQHVINGNIERFIEVFLGVFGIAIPGTMLFLGRARWTPINKDKCVVGVGLPQGIKDKNRKVQEAAEHALRINNLLTEMEALPKAEDSQEGELENNPEDKRIENFLDYIRQSLEDFRGDILAIQIPFLRDLFLFLELQRKIEKLETTKKRKEHFKIQLEIGVSKIHAILNPSERRINTTLTQNEREDEERKLQARINRLSIDKRRNQRIGRLMQIMEASTRAQEKSTLEEEIERMKEEIERLKKQFEELSVQILPTNLQIMEGIYASFGLRDKIPEMRNIRTIYNHNDLRKLVIRGLLQIANIISKEGKLSGISQNTIQEVHRWNRIRLSIHGDVSKLQDLERTCILEEWSQARVQTVLTTTIALMVGSIDTQVTYSIKPPENTPKAEKKPTPRKKIQTIPPDTDTREPESTTSPKEKQKQEIQANIKQCENKLQTFLQYHNQQLKSLATDISRIRETIKSRKNGLHPKQSRFSDFSEEELDTILKTKESQLTKLARKSTKKMIHNEIEYQSIKTELGLLQRRLKRLSR